MKIRLLKVLDALAGRFAACCLSAAPAAKCADPLRILVIRPGGIGDAVLLIPALRLLTERFPGAALTVLAEKRNCEVFSLFTDAGVVLCYDRSGELLAAVRGGYDVVIDTEQWYRLSAVVARLAGAPLSVGFATNKRGRLFSSPIPYSQDAYEMESFFTLLAPLGLRVPQPSALPFLTIPEGAARRAEELLAPLHGARFVAVFAGASVAEKRWGTGRFRQVVSLLNEKNIPVVLLGAREDQTASSCILQGHRGLDLAGMTSLAETAGIIERAALLLSGDSGVLHLAAGVATPSVSLFGPSCSRKWGPRGERHTVLTRGLPCSPCSSFGTTPRCRTGVPCLTGLGAQEVADAVCDLLDRGKDPQFPAGRTLKDVAPCTSTKAGDDND